MEIKPLLILLSLTLILSLIPTPTQSQNLILEIRKFDTYFKVPYVAVPTVSHNVYNISENLLEWEIILNQKVLFQSISFQFQSENLKFYYQPPLNEELDAKDYDFINATHAIKDGQVLCYRPLNVVGSYAVYHGSKRDNEYATGKLFHIYRPFLIDSKLQTSWANLTINNNVMTITVDQNFLSTATYPVIIDPTFGTTTIGATTYTCSYLGTTVVFGDAGTPVNDGTANFISAVMYVSGSHTANVKACLYNDSDDTLIGSGFDSSVSLDSNVIFRNMSVSDSVVSGTTYAVSCCANYTDTNIYIRYDAEGNVGHLLTGDNYASMFYNPISWTTKTYARHYSIYCNYTVLEEGQDLSFDLFENILFYGSSQMLKELGFSHFENVRFHSSSLMLKEFGFLLFETVKFYGSSSLGKELRFLFGETIRFHSSIISSFEGVALDLTFILFETVSFVASRIADLSEVVVVVTELDVGSLAGLALIIAVIALALVFVYKKQ